MEIIFNLSRWGNREKGLDKEGDLGWGYAAMIYGSAASGEWVVTFSSADVAGGSMMPGGELELTRPIQEVMDFMGRIKTQLNRLDNGPLRILLLVGSTAIVGSSADIMWTCTMSPNGTNRISGIDVVGPTPLSLIR